MTEPLTDWQVVRQSHAIHPDWDAETHVAYLESEIGTDPSWIDWQATSADRLGLNAVEWQVAHAAVERGDFTTPSEVLRFFEKPRSYPELLVAYWLEEMADLPPLEPAP